MSSDTNIDRIYFHLSTALLLLLAVAIYSFYPHYLGVLHLPQPWYMHAHFALMAVWMSLLIAQPILIRRQDYVLHRRLGTMSYLIFPLILVSAYSMTQFGYHRIVTELQQQSVLTEDQITHQARKEIGLAFYSVFVLLVFYPLAIAYRKRPAFHARFMVAAATSLVGPILDRAVYQLADAAKLPVLGYEYVSFFLIDIIFLLLIYRDYRKGQLLAPNTIAFLFFALSQVGYAFFRDSAAWQGFVGAVL